MKKRTISKMGVVCGLALSLGLVLTPVTTYAGVVEDAQAQLQEAQNAHNKAIADENKVAVEAMAAPKVAAQKAAIAATEARAAVTKANNEAIAAQNKAAVEAANAEKVAAQKAAVAATEEAARQAAAHNKAVAEANAQAVAARLIAAMPK